MSLLTCFICSGYDSFVVVSSTGNSLAMIIPIIVAMLVLAVIAVIGFIDYKKRTGKRQKQKSFLLDGLSKTE